MRLLEAAANTLAEMGDTEEIEALFQASGADGEKTVQEYKETVLILFNCYQKQRALTTRRRKLQQATSIAIRFYTELHQA
jgi:hypothetical protein